MCYERRFIVHPEISLYYRPSDLWLAQVIVPIISKYGPSHSKAVGPVDPSFLVVKKSHLNKNIQLTASQ